MIENIIMSKLYSTTLFARLFDEIGEQEIKKCTAELLTSAIKSDLDSVKITEALQLFLKYCTNFTPGEFHTEHHRIALSILGEHIMFILAENEKNIYFLQACIKNLPIIQRARKILLGLDMPENEKTDFQLYKIDVFPDDLILFHGTSFENYQEILKTGYINPSDYSTLSSKYVAPYFRSAAESVIDNHSGYVFCDSNLDIPIRFSGGGYRKNINQCLSVNPEERKHIPFSIDCEGVIFAIKPTNYELYYNFGEHTYAIKGCVALKDTDTIFTHFKDGRITLTGGLTNVLCYE